MTEKEYRKLRDEHEAAQESSAEARGQLNGLRDRLQNEFGLKTPEEARKRLAELAKSKARLEQELDEVADAYRKGFPDENET